eukprot:TRINITY_DN11304_c0_g1_i4.p1 TRINITY_DN11304_c0_g1~~TRINITY_DN11304_c0_g1_i4.p1  ORF type:complete len:205 (+),score=35.33 TRINITY_DN11304_c0_g1_i4:159-773(+)
MCIRDSINAEYGGSLSKAMTQDATTIRCCLVGDNVGKTWLAMTWDGFDVLSANRLPKVAEVSHLRLKIDGKEVTATIVDTDSNVENPSERALAYGDVDLVLLCYAVDSCASLTSLEVWASTIPNGPRVLVGCRSDRNADPEYAQRLVPESMIERAAKDLGAGVCMQCSVVTGEHCAEVLNKALRWYIQQHKKTAPKQDACCIVL